MMQVPKLLVLFCGFVCMCLSSKAQLSLTLTKGIPQPVKSILSKEEKLVHPVLSLKENNNIIAYLAFYTSGDSIGYLIDGEIRSGFSKSIVGMYIAASGKSKAIIDSFTNDITAVNMQSIFLANADLETDKEISVVVSQYTDISLRHGEMYKTYFYKVPPEKSSSSNRLVRKQLVIEGDCFCESPTGSVQKPTMNSAAKIREALLKRGYMQQSR